MVFGVVGRELLGVLGVLSFFLLLLGCHAVKWLLGGWVWFSGCFMLAKVF